MSLKYGKPELQDDLDATLADINEDSLRVFETQITSSQRFQDGVAETRNSVGIDFPTYHESGRNGAEINADILLDRNKLSDNRVREIIESEKFKKCVDKLMQDTGLPNHWREYVIAYITGQPVNKERLSVFTNEHILLESIDDNSLTIKIKKGTRYDEYVRAWETLAKHLGKGRRKDSSRDNAARDMQMYHSFYYRGLTLKEIAELYLNTDIEYGVDTVKKAIRRQKKLFDEGTDLAK